MNMDEFLRYNTKKDEKKRLHYQINNNYKNIHNNKYKLGKKFKYTFNNVIENTNISKLLYILYRFLLKKKLQ